MDLRQLSTFLRVGEHGILRQVEEARAELLQEAGAVRRRVVFGLPPTVGAVAATRLIERFLTANPEVTLRIVQAFSGDLLEWLQGGEVDIAVVYGGLGAAGVRTSPLLVETLVLVAPAGAPLPPHHAVPFPRSRASACCWRRRRGGAALR
jgi:DNA-binding transcriptional LysR family regulator